MQGQESLDLADHLAAGAIRVKHLVEKAEEGATDRKDSLSAVGTLVGLSQQGRRQDALEEQIQVPEALLAERLHAPAHGREAGAPGKEERSLHMGRIYTAQRLDSPVMLGP